MNLLHVNSEKSWRGGEQQLAYLIQNLKELKPELTQAVASAPNPKLKAFCKAESVPFFEIPFKGAQFISAYKLWSLTRSHPFDLIHCHSSNAHTACALMSLINSKTPLVISKRTDFPIKSPWKYRLKSVKAILCVSKKIEQIVKTKIEGPTKTIYSGVNSDRFHRLPKKDLKGLLGLSKNIRLVINTSAMAPHKDYPTFLKTAQKLKEKSPHFKFAIIGRGPLETQIKAMTEEMGLSDTVFFTGFLEELPQYLASADYFLMTSNEEGLGTSLLDAMVCKVPIVATEAGGIPEIVKNLETGLTASVGDSAELSKNLERFESDSKLRDEIVERAYNMATNNFSSLQTAKETLLVYQSIINGDACVF